MANILFLCDSYSPNRGGSEHVASVLARAGVALGHAVVVLTRTSDQPRCDERAHDANEPYVIVRSRIWRWLFHLGSSRFSVVNRLARVAIIPLLFGLLFRIRGRIDILVINHVIPGANVAAAMKRFRRFRVILITHGEDVTVYSRGRRMRTLLVQGLRSADVIRCYTSGSAEEIRGLCPEVSGKIVIQPPPARIEVFDVDLAQVEAIREQHGLKGKRVALTLSRLVPRKGIDVTIAAMSLLASEFPDLVYLVVGDGPFKGALEQLATSLGVSDRVVFTGRVETVGPYYHVCDLFVMPNRTMPDGEREGYGLVFCEAGAAGKPVIGGRSGGAVDAIEEGKTGFLVDPESPEAVAEAMRQLLVSPGLRARMGGAGRERAVAVFDPAVVESEFEFVIRQALNGAN